MTSRSIHPQPSKRYPDGHKVRYRHPDGKPGAITLQDRRSAEKMIQLIDALGVTEALKRVGRETRPQSQSHSTPTVSETLEKYSASRPDFDTRRLYRVLSRQINSRIGETPIGELTVDDVQTCLNQITIASVKQVHMLLCAALSAAIQRGEIAENPARKAPRSGGVGVRLSRRLPFEAIFLDRKECAAVLAALPHRGMVLAQFLLASGCRIGEALALTPTDIGSDGMVRFNKSLGRRTIDDEGKTALVLGPTKTGSSIRTIPVPQAALDQLDLSRGYVFTTATGLPIDSDKFRERVWAPAMLASGLPKHRRPRIHDLRHTHASRLIEAGVPIPAVSKRLGHATIATTLGTYAHVAASADEKILAALA